MLALYVGCRNGDTFAVEHVGGHVAKWSASPTARREEIARRSRRVEPPRAAEEVVRRCSAPGTEEVDAVRDPGPTRAPCIAASVTSMSTFFTLSCCGGTSIAASRKRFDS